MRSGPYLAPERSRPCFEAGSRSWQLPAKRCSCANLGACDPQQATLAEVDAPSYSRCTQEPRVTVAKEVQMT